jgi:hypothetical protein
MLSSGQFPGVWILYANVSEHCVCSIFRGAYEDGTEFSEMLAYEIQTAGYYPEESIQHLEHSENLKSRKKKTFLYNLPLRPTLKPAQSPIQLVSNPFLLCDSAVACCRPSFASEAEVKNEGLYLHYRTCFHIMHGENCTFNFIFNSGK